jgi:hypothetical protein
MTELQLNRPQRLPGGREVDTDHHFAGQSDHRVSTCQSPDGIFLDPDPRIADHILGTSILDLVRGGVVSLHHSPDLVQLRERHHRGQNDLPDAVSNISQVIQGEDIRGIGSYALRNDGWDGRKRGIERYGRRFSLYNTNDA